MSILPKSNHTKLQDCRKQFARKKFEITFDKFGPKKDSKTRSLKGFRAGITPSMTVD